MNLNLDKNPFKTEKSKNRLNFLWEIEEEFNEEFKRFTDNTTSIELHDFLENYNWDDGFEIPYYIINHKNCELATALNAFYLAEGLDIFDDDFEDSFDENWIYFIKYLYKKIVYDKYLVKTISYKIPLTDIYKKELEDTYSLEKVFLEDILL
ncbi:DUF4274 domain-containing protein [Clostridium lundense]|uniref:DUF4274 domain-containing protein n=1 Tax=Clostridium lundense TaxID=319475 RepID=UPI000688146F|nr:DUF4274 domain-containing protein [Clostridium lundense]